MTVTIKDIAKRVGVSPSTVSRVINGTASISDETKGKIKTAMQELDYHPNSLARSLVNGNTFTVGLVIDAGNKDAFSNAFFIQSVSAIEAVTQECSYNLLITNDNNRENNNAVKNLVLEKKVDGIILPVSAMTEELIELMVTNNFPFVVMGEPENHANEVHWVDMDNELGGYLAVTHLFEQGYKNPVFLVENKGTIFENKRCNGFRKGFIEKKDAWDKKYIIECGNDGEAIDRKLKKMLNENKDIDSIVCTNNIVAYHVLKSLKKEGLCVPNQIGIITFDNYPLAEYLEPALSVIDVDTYKLGEKAAMILFDQIKHSVDVEKGTLLPTQIINRKSTQKGEGNFE